MKINLGCGERPMPGFVNLDSRRLPGVDVVAVLPELPFEDNTASYIYACCVLEHFRLNDARILLKECLRALKKGGILRLSVPDFLAIAEIYLKNRNIYEVGGMLMGRQNYSENTHYLVFDEVRITSMMMDAGFVNVRRYDWRTTEHSDFDDYSQAYLPHMDKEHGRLMSINMEGQKL